MNMKIEVVYVLQKEVWGRWHDWYSSPQQLLAQKELRQRATMDKTDNINVKKLRLIERTEKELVVQIIQPVV